MVYEIVGGLVVLCLLVGGLCYFKDHLRFVSNGSTKSKVNRQSKKEQSDA